MSIDKEILQQFSEHIYWLPPDERTDRPVLGLIVGQTGSLVVDAGNSPAHANLLLRQASALNLPPIRFVVLTHWHWDHLFGTAVYHCPIIAHSETKRVASQMAAWDWSDEALDQRVRDGIEIEFCRDMIKAELPDRRNLVIRPPDVTFSTEMAVDLGGITCRILHVGGDHADDSTIVHVPEEKFVFLSDCVYPSIYTNPRQYTVEKIGPLFETILNLDAEHFMFGHEMPVVDRMRLQEDAEQVKTVGNLVLKMGNDTAGITAVLHSSHPDWDAEWSQDLIALFQAGSQFTPVDPTHV